MKKVQTSFFLLFLFILLSESSCKKDPEIIEGTLHGLVIDHVTREPVAGAKIIFRYRDQCQWSDSDFCWTVLDSTSYVTNAEGKFIIDYRVEARKVANADASFGAKPKKEGYFFMPGLSNGIFSRNTDTLTIALWPMTYLRVHILDVNPGPDRKYDGIRLRHSTYISLDSIKQNPLDTTIILVGDPFEYPLNKYNAIVWNLFYLDQPQIIGPIRTIPQVQCPPHDTCDVEIRF
jgi:hypothetical protein